MQNAVAHGKIAADQAQLALGLQRVHARECAQIGEADAHGGKFHRLCRCCAMNIGVRMHHFFAFGREHRYPIGNKATFAGRRACQILVQRRIASAAAAMPHDDDFFDLQELHRKFECGRNAMSPWRGFERRDECAHVAHNKNLAGVGVKYLCRVDPTVAAGDNHHARALPLTQLRPPVALSSPILRTKPAVTRQHIIESRHACAIGEDMAVEKGAHRRYGAAMASNAPQPAARTRKPDWIRVKAPTSHGVSETRRLMRDLNLHTVCEEAACPNIGECWTKKHATVMILGDTCTRACAFCNIKTGMPRAVDPLEPEHVARVASTMGLSHIVITSVDRDDLPDGGASQFVKVIEALRRDAPGTTIEILTPDFRNKPMAAVESIIAARPDVYNHNLETVPRLYPTIRPGARYYASLRLLESVKRMDPSIFTKSGIMLGLGEERMEVHQVMDDMRSADIDFLTMGQYLQPTPRHAKVIDFVTPDAFGAYAQIARAKGFLQVASSPLTRSSYHAGEDFEQMRAARAAQLAKNS